MEIYRSREFLFHNRAAVVAMLLSLVAIVVAMVLSGVWGDLPGLGIAIAVILVAMLLAPLTITVEEGGSSAADSDAIIHVSLAGVMRRSIPLADVSDIKRRDYRPLRDFGGWGWRYAWRRPAVAYAIRGTSAVVLKLRNGSEVYLGVNDEQGLIDALQPRIYR